MRPTDTAIHNIFLLVAPQFSSHPFLMSSIGRRLLNRVTVISRTCGQFCMEKYWTFKKAKLFAVMFLGSSIFDLDNMGHN